MPLVIQERLVTTAETVTTVILAQPELEERLVILVVRVTLVIPEMMALTERLEQRERLVLAMLVTLVIPEMLVTAVVEAEAAVLDKRVTENSITPYLVIRVVLVMLLLVLVVREETVVLVETQGKQGMQGVLAPLVV